MVTRARFERVTPSFGGWRPNPCRAVVALLLVIGSGYQLRFQTPESKPIMLAWGFIFMCGCLFFVRSMLTINKMGK